MLASDRRMQEFWEWLADTRPPKWGFARSGTSVARAIWQSTRLPGKPSNMTPAQRTAFFEKVRKHALALSELLRDTIFDQSGMRELAEHELDEPLEKKLYSWGDDEIESGHVVAFTVNGDGAHQMPYDYPRSNLTETLWELVEWTHWDDQWDGGIFSSSAPIVQANADSVRIVYFTCSLHDWFSSYGMDIPFPVLATVANVALVHGADEQVDEDTVRKQVRRYQNRKAKRREGIPETLADSGPNSAEIGNSVLSDPF